MIFQNFQVLKCIKPKFTNFPGFQGGVRTLRLFHNLIITFQINVFINNYDFNISKLYFNII